ncbi:MAG: glycerophosphodiester phosphodiesterase family protein [Rothia sp. (in: high G+C Gram-positive bacteria)]|nr:glycerophosphodiester phosphodiesterase family protein [Rothia sp. (in: high G+C Gram-positive bacteria)]
MPRRIFAHRGLSSVAPENTLVAIGACAENNVKWFETDIDILGDGTPVVIHDTLLDRTTNRTGSIYDLSAKDLEGIDAGSWFGREYRGQKLPTLAQLVELMNKKELNGNIELKPNGQGAEKAIQLIDAVIAELENLDDDREVIISSFDYLALAEFKRRAPQYCVAALMGPEMLASNWRTTLEFIDADAVHPDAAALTPELVDEMHAASFEINAWTVNSRGRANELFNWGVDGIITDYAHEFVDLAKANKSTES